jgi:mannan endo-1,4-beta-mannosidase
VRLVLPLVNNWDLLNTRDASSVFYGSVRTYDTWEGDVKANPNLNTTTPTGSSVEFDTSDFYSNPRTIADFEQHVQAVLTHVNTITGVPYKDDPTILGWETGNEISPPSTWTDTISTYIKSIDPNHLVIDGTHGINDGNGTYGGPVDAKPPVNVCGGDLGLPNVDVYDDHFYPMDTSIVTGDGDAVASCNKAFIAGEYDWKNNDGGDPLSTFLPGIQNDPNVSGDMLWDLFSHSPEYGWEDGAECSGTSGCWQLNYPGQGADDMAREQTLRSHAYAMAGEAVPAHAPVTAPRITVVTPKREIAWRGTAGPTNYSVQYSTSTADGPWTTICALCATDTSTPWQDPQSVEGATIWYRVQADNLDGVLGPWSAPYQFVASGYR